MPLYSFQQSSQVSGQVRATGSLSIASLTANSTLQTTMSLAKTFFLLQISSNYAIRLRLYIDSSHQQNDLARAIGTLPTGDHGVLFDGLFTPSVLTINLAPIVVGSSLTASNQIPCTINNLSNSNISNLNINYSYLPLEL